MTIRDEEIRKRAYSKHSLYDGGQGRGERKDSKMETGKIMFQKKNRVGAKQSVPCFPLTHHSKYSNLPYLLSLSPSPPFTHPHTHMHAQTHTDTHHTLYSGNPESQLSDEQIGTSANALHTIKPWLISHFKHCLSHHLKKLFPFLWKCSQHHLSSHHIETPLHTMCNCQWRKVREALEKQ